MKYWAFILFIVLNWCAAAKPVYDFNANNKAAYSDIIKGKIAAIFQSFNDLKQSQPDNLVPVFLEDYAAFIRLFLLEDEKDFSRYIKNNEVAVIRLEKGDAASPFHLYCLAETYLHRAFAQFMFEDYWAGYWNMRRAYLLLLENKKKFPSFIASEKDIALIHVLTGILPANFHWAVSVTGIKPDLDGGMNLLKKLIAQTNENSFLFRDEAILMYGTLLFYTGKEKNDAIELYQKNDFPKKDNLLSYLIFVNMLLHSNQNESCSKIICDVPQSSAYIKVPVLHYYQGLNDLQQLKSGTANHFEKYIAETKSNHFIKSAYHKMAWGYLIQGNEKLYAENISKVLTIGKSAREPDKQALKEAQSSDIPNPEILKSRLLFDGGYYEQALNILEKLNPESLTSEKNKVELMYRKARVHDKMTHRETATRLYKETVSKGEMLPYYFAANAALQLGFIYEEKGDKPEAKKYYDKCLSLKNHEYVNSLSQKAKAGLERLK
jgi:tetratricopeptide (TPR) repeat protein